MKLYMCPYKISSRSAKVLAKMLGATRLARKGPVKFNADDVVLNWGTTDVPSEEYLKVKVLNDFYAVRVASDKLFTFNALKQAGVSAPKFTEEKDIAINWAKQNTLVLARTLLRGHSGKGIVGPTSNHEEIPPAPLYVEYIKKYSEYRVHVVGNNLLIHQKKKRTGVEASYHVRSHDNGWVFCRYEGDDLFTVRLVALAHDAIKAVSLNFGAVDIIYNSHYDKLYVLEINTAPGIENSSTLEFYTNSIKELLQYTIPASNEVPK